MSIEKVQIVEKILDANDQMALENQQVFDQKNILAINIMASPGAGKTSLILRTIEGLASDYKIAVIEGDTAPVTIDADKIYERGIPVTQINTGGDCHLDALMVRKGMQALNLEGVDLVIIENVGNLICPAAFKLGSHLNVAIASIPEGDDKPYKYPNIYRGIQCLVLNKTDLLPYVDFNLEYFKQGIRILNPGVDILPLSSKTGEGMDAWLAWLCKRINEKKHAQK
ncbi:MAG: hydrogenase nickel incorporation protein HypB [Anaerolineae bacterium]|nr:hydrogenase nickel incorporation protein HypB [Anaerolineae bacterium]